MPKYTSIQETAYNYVRNKVLTGQLQPNVLYSETKMAAEIHISRTPMKDALVRLSQDRFIDIIRGQASGSAGNESRQGHCSTDRKTLQPNEQLCQPDAVSYTHLDVYKRQRQGEAL